MPTVLRAGPYRVYFYSHEPNEPPHVHIDREKLSAKFWLNSTRFARNFGFSSKELRQIEQLIKEHDSELLEAWNEHFSVGGR
ncbi:MAG TPA: DUF4160 domain-containing protein [Pyrinomonadaceae bacterium]|nr:DUF4160 domain-containing protein [Pyrinomonadaceae bacterium]